jgi:hypothetical protein
VVPGGFDQQPPSVPVARRRDRACAHRASLDVSLGTSPGYEPIEEPVNRCQPPISTASPSPVSVLTARRQHSRSTTARTAL